MRGVLSILLMAAVGGIFYLGIELAKARTEVAAAVRATDRAVVSAAKERELRIRTEEKLDKLTYEKEASELAEVLEARKAEIAKIEQIYQEERAALIDREAALDTKISVARRHLQKLQDNPPRFTEHGTRTSNITGSIVSTGIRTSDADRVEVQAEYNRQLETAYSQLSKLEGEETYLRNAYDTLKSQYRAATEKAKQSR